MKLWYIKTIFLLCLLLLNVSCFQSQSEYSYEDDDAYDNEVVDCNKCDGDGRLKITCTNCNGLGSLQGWTRETGRGLCSTCDGSRHVVCTNCHGRGIEQCEYCYGRKSKCRQCNGSGTLFFELGGEVEFVNCPTCKGSGYEQCCICDGMGYYQCQKCGGDGWVYCPTCIGSGLGDYQTTTSTYSTTCQECEGDGYFVVECEKCYGSGKIKRSEL